MNKFAVIIGLFAVLLHTGFALKCYQCGDEYLTDTSCNDPMGNAKETTCTGVTSCVKVKVLTMDDDQVGVYRDCMPSNYIPPIKRALVSEAQVLITVCSGDLCNVSNRFAPISFITVLFPACIAFLFFGFSKN